MGGETLPPGTPPRRDPRPWRAGEPAWRIRRPGTDPRAAPGRPLPRRRLDARSIAGGGVDRAAPGGDAVGGYATHRRGDIRGRSCRRQCRFPGRPERRPPAGRVRRGGASAAARGRRRRGRGLRQGGKARAGCRRGRRGRCVRGGRRGRPSSGCPGAGPHPGGRGVHASTSCEGVTGVSGSWRVTPCPSTGAARAMPRPGPAGAPAGTSRRPGARAAG